MSYIYSIIYYTLCILHNTIYITFCTLYLSEIIRDTIPPSKQIKGKQFQPFPTDLHHHLLYYIYIYYILHIIYHIRIWCLCIIHILWIGLLALFDYTVDITEQTKLDLNAWTPLFPMITICVILSYVYGIWNTYKETCTNIIYRLYIDYVI